MVSNGSRNSDVWIHSRTASPTALTKSRKKRRSAPKRKVDRTEVLPPELLKHISSFLHHPVNRVALRQTSSAFRSAVNRHPTKRNALRSLALRYSQPEGMYPAAQNRFIMSTSRRRYMKNDQAREYLEKMFTHKGNGNIFVKSNIGNALIFPGMYHAVPTDNQRLALARAITGDHSEKGIKFMYKLIRKIQTGRKGDRQSAVRAISPRSLASMYSKKGPGRRKVLKNGSIILELE